MKALRNIFSKYTQDKLELKNTAPLKIQDININFTLCGDNALKYRALMEVSNVDGMYTQEMLKRIFERGICKEFEYWQSKSSAGSTLNYSGTYM